MKTKNFLLIAAAGLSLTFASCRKNDGYNPEMTKVNVKITDGPGTYDALYLSVKEIIVLTSQGQTTLTVNSNPFNILNFRLGKDTLIASQDIPSGKLQELRLVLNTTGNKVVVDGVSYDLNTPSGQTAGIKLKVQEDLVPDVAYTLTLDFDAAKSVVKTGNGGYLLKPVIRAIPNSVSGAIAGTISPAASSPKIYAINGTDTLGTISDASGKFWFPGVAAGTYKVEIMPVSPYNSKTLDGVVVENGSVKDLGTITITQPVIVIQ